MSGKKLYQYPSPCLRCTRVRKPQMCENKQCKPWRQWFVDQWELIHRYPRQQMDSAKLTPIGVRVGGRYYAAPHQVETYLRKDPCKTCLCPADLCATPCRVRRSWEESRTEVLQ